MGGMQVLEWAVSYPDMMKCVIPIATTTRMSAQGIAFDWIGREAIQSDPQWHGGNYRENSANPARGLGVARMIAHITYLSDESMTRKIGRNLQNKESYSFDFAHDFAVESYLEYQGQKFVERFDANCYCYITRATDYFDLTAHANGDLVRLTKGTAYAARITDVHKGKHGAPGQLKGAMDGIEKRGCITRNTCRGIFGKPDKKWSGIPLPVAEYDEIVIGDATIRSTVDEHGPRDYSVEILKIYPEEREDGRNILLRGTDPALLAATGGIVQGMSGSPIIQDGKLVGAVTHVLVNDPTRGYGIFIDNMLDAAS